MSESQFLYIKTRQKPYVKFPWYIGKKGQWKYLFRRFPYESHQIDVLGRKGMVIELPFTKKQLEEKNSKVLSDILYRLQIETGSSYLAVERSLEKIFSFEWICDGKNLALYMAEKIIDEIGNWEKIPKKNMHIVILAGDDIYTGFLLKKLGAIYNYITLVAEDEGVYNEYLQMLYAEHGLVVSFLEKQSVKMGWIVPLGDVYIDLTGKDNSFCKVFPKDAKILDLLCEKDIRYYQGKREDIKVYNGFSFGKEKEIPGGLIQAALGQESSWLMKGSLDDYEKLIEALDLKVFSIKAQFS